MFPKIPKPAVVSILLDSLHGLVLPQDRYVFGEIEVCSPKFDWELICWRPRKTTSNSTILGCTPNQPQLYFRLRSWLHCSSLSSRRAHYGEKD